MHSVTSPVHMHEGTYHHTFKPHIVSARLWPILCIIAATSCPFTLHLKTAGMLQIVANNRNGLDVDKYDYLQRDSMYCNTKISVDIKRIFSFVKVPARICMFSGVVVMCIK